MSRRIKRTLEDIRAQDRERQRRFQEKKRKEEAQAREARRLKIHGVEVEMP